MIEEGLQLADFDEWSGGGGVVGGRDSVFFFAGESPIRSGDGSQATMVGHDSVGCGRHDGRRHLHLHRSCSSRLRRTRSRSLVPCCWNLRVAVRLLLH